MSLRRAAALLLFAALLLYSGCRYRALRAGQEAVRELAAISAASPAPEQTPDTVPMPEDAGRFAPLLERNADFAGWLHIDDTMIDYPVMQSPDRPDYYLHRDFDGQPSEAGTPYLSAACDLHSDNLLIYGHNMRDGTMFSDLLRYGDEAYYRAHPTLRFDTPEASGSYAVLAVFRERVHTRQETGVFRYYSYAGLLTEETFDDYLAGIRAAALYDTGCTAVWGDQLLTLSTCAYHVPNGRFVLVAVKQT